MISTLSLLPLFFLLAKSALASLFTDPSQLRSTTYDYIVVGGKVLFHVFLPLALIVGIQPGPRGAFLLIAFQRMAMSESSSLRPVGGGNSPILMNLTTNTHFLSLFSDNGTDVANIRIPFNAPIATPGTPFDWNYTTVNQVALNNQPEAYPRGKVLGGTSTTSMLFGLDSYRFCDSVCLRLSSVHSGSVQRLRSTCYSGG